MSEINYQEGHETAGQAKPVAWRYRYVKKGVTDFQENLWVAAAMKGIRAAVVPIMISAVVGMVGSAFKYPPCFAVMLLVIALYLLFNVNFVYLVILGAVCGIVIAEIYERKGEKKHGTH